MLRGCLQSLMWAWGFDVAMLLLQLLKLLPLLPPLNTSVYGLRSSYLQISNPPGAAHF